MKRKILLLFTIFITAILNAQVRITEVMPCNLSSVMNDDYNFTGYVEFYNDSDKEVSLSSYILSHYELKKSGEYVEKWSWKIDRKFKVKPKSYKLMWMDEKNMDGHAPYKLDTDGGYLTLYVHSSDLVEEDTVVVPDSTVIMPDTTMIIPDTTVILPDTVMIMPDSTVILPDTVMPDTIMPEPLTLTESDLQDSIILIDSFAYGKMDAHYAYGRWKDTVGYMMPSPKADNTHAYPALTKAYRCTKPSVSVTPGIAKDSFYVKLTSTTENALIYYTLDGTEPSEDNGFLFEDSILIKKNTNIRARAYKDSLLASKMMVASYFFTTENREECGGFTVPIVSVTVDPDYFYDDMIGICVTGKNGIRGEKDCQYTGNFNQDWKRPVSFEYIVDGKRVVSQELEAAVEGGCSRGESVKSISLKASSKTGDKDIDYNFFNSKPDIVNQTLHVRNGGTAYNQVRFRDGLMQTFAVGMNIDYQGYQPVAYYINGSYKGLMNLNERSNADYIKANHGFSEEEIDLITVSDQLGIRASKGDLDAYNEMVNYLKNSDPEDSTYYEGACERIDMAEYIDYQVFQQFIVNMDWPGNNTKIWRERREGGKFRWILFDTDFGFGFSHSVPNYTYSDMFKWCTGSGITSWANNRSWMTDIFASLSKNAKFRKTFVSKYKKHLETTFSRENIETVFDSITAIVSAEYCVSFNSSAEKDVARMKEFALSRNGSILSQMDSYLGDVEGVEVDKDITSVSLFYYLPQQYKAMVLSEEDIISVGIYDISGRKLSEEMVGDTYYEYDMSKFGKGIYIINARFKNGTVSKKILVEGL